MILKYQVLQNINCDFYILLMFIQFLVNTKLLELEYFYALKIIFQLIKPITI